MHRENLYYLTKPVLTLKLVFTFLLISICHSSELIIEPLEGKAGQPKVLVFLPGGFVEPKFYEKLLNKVQQEVQEPIWIVAMKFTGNIPQPLGLKGRIKRALDDLSLQANHQFNKSDVWIAGHSLGGITAQRVVDEYRGLILLSAYFDRLQNREKSGLEQFKKPVLILSGELDGMTRPAYLARDFQFDSTNQNPENFNKITILLEGLNHSLFAYEDKLIKGDIPTNYDPVEAKTQIVQAVGSFINLHEANTTSHDKQNAFEILKQIKIRSNQLLRAYKKAETFDQLVCKDAQEYLIKDYSSQTGKMDIKTSQIEQIANFALAKPAFNSNQDGPASIEVIQHSQRYSNILDRGNLSLAPKALYCKMKSVEAVANAQSLFELSQKSACSRIQQRIMDDTLGLLNEVQYQRYLDSGKTLNLDTEKKHSTGIGWLSARASLIKKVEDSFLVKPHSLYTGMDAPKRFRGMTYCKLVSPARILDWYLIDALIPE